ncbi:MAG: hypothetical protein QNK20_07245 [Aureibaculum sp.]|nr:hypothetical protein [Aureibaculum sp.]
MCCDKLNIFLNAINNEIDIDRDLIQRLGRGDLRFTPLRGLKWLQYIDKYHISSFVYGIFSVLFLVLSPVYFFIKMLKMFFSKKNNASVKPFAQKELVLVANGRVEHLVKRVMTPKSLAFININQPYKQSICHVYQFLRLKDFFYAYVYSISAAAYLFWKLEDKKDILQVYVAYEWFLVYLALSRHKDGIVTIYFANHYDRWAVMFDQLYADKNVVLMQHGILPEELNLSYKLRNLSKVFAFNDHSVQIFKNMFECKNAQFQKLDISLSLVDVTTEKKSILIIGQPHSLGSEVEIVESLGDELEVFIKPHPLYDSSEYKKLSNVTWIEDRSFYPKVDVALCYESTLGLEYEASGVKVIWWKGLNMHEIIMQIKNTL